MRITKNNTVVKRINNRRMTLIRVDKVIDNNVISSTYKWSFIRNRNIYIERALTIKELLELYPISVGKRLINIPYFEKEDNTEIEINFCGYTNLDPPYLGWYSGTDKIILNKIKKYMDLYDPYSTYPAGAI